MQQTEMVNLEDLVPASHSYRKFISLWSFKYPEKQLEKDNPYKSYSLLRLFKCLM